MSPRVEVRVVGDLNDFLAAARRHRPLAVEVASGTTVKDLAESLGVPHTEIDVILVDGTSVGFGHRLGGGRTMTLYPLGHRLEGACAGLPVVHLVPDPPWPRRFVLDVHLGRLARLLRLLGFDAVWRNDLTDRELASLSAEERRVLLTRDRGILKRAMVVYGYYVRRCERRSQAVEVLHRFELFGEIQPFGRCLECNGVPQPVPKDEVLDQLPPRTRRDFQEFHRCPGCGRVYWRGSHYDRLADVIEDIRRAGGGDA